MVYYWLKMANLGLGTYSNSFLHFWNFQFVHQKWALGPLIYFQNTLKRSRKVTKSFSGLLVCISQNILNILDIFGDLKVSNLWKVWDTKISKMILVGPKRLVSPSVLNNSGKYAGEIYSKILIIVDNLKT